jgi:hypothetical protein
MYQTMPEKKRLRAVISLLFVTAFFLITSRETRGQQIRVGTFNVDATPPIGAPVAYAKTRSITDFLSARGVVILSEQLPVVLCAVDWIGISNEGQDAWKTQLAKAANTTEDRVSVHVLHQHDGPICDFTIEKILSEYNLGGISIDNAFVTGVIQKTADAVTAAIKTAKPVTRVGFGQAKVEKVASNRRILGPDGKVSITRWSSTTDPAAIAAPEGTIDPWLKSVSFWNESTPVAVLTYYATHPQSHYGKGDVTCEFIGIARNEREKVLGIPHIHFNGAGGNVTAGKYNDGAPATRPILAARVASAMRQAWEQTNTAQISGKDLSWKNIKVQLPLGKNIVEADLRKRLSNTQLSYPEKYAAAEKLAWYQRSTAGEKVNISALKIGKNWLLNLPGELFVEYQLNAQKLRPADEQVCTAAYEEYGPGYIGTKISYTQGGYETTDIVSGVAPEVENVLMQAIRAVLQ